MSKKTDNEGFIAVCIRKPILPIVISIFVFLLGYFALLKMEIRNTPKIPSNRFLIVCHTKNPTSAQEVDKLSEKIEKLLPTVGGIDYFSSSSEQSVSKIRVTFKPGIKEINAFNDLRDVMARVQLGSEAKSPQIYSQSDDDCMMFIDFYPKESSEKDILFFDKLAEFLKNVLKNNIRKIDGVGNVEIQGYSKPYFSLDLKLFEMSRLGIRPQDIHYAINHATQVSTLAPIKTYTRTFALASSNHVNSREILQNIVIDHKRGILLKDVANITIKSKDYQRVNLLNGKTQTIRLLIYKTSEGNPLLIKKEVDKLLRKFVDKETGYRIKNNYENSEIIFDKTKQTFLEAVFLLFIVLIFFLGSIRILILPLIAIPLSIAGTFLFMWQFGFSINEITLMAFLLSIGLLVDDAILIIEKIERDRGRSKVFDENVVIKATTEIYKSVIVMTATLFCVFVPVVFLPGEMGYTLREFAITISISVGWSCVFSLILTPMLCKYFMKNYQPFAWTERWLNWLENLYKNLLRKLLNYTKRILSVVLVLTIASMFLFTQIKSEYYPQTKSQYFYIYTNGLENFKIEFLRQEGDKIRKILDKYKELEYFYLDVSNGEIDINGKINGNKDIILKKVHEDLKKYLPYITFMSYGNDSDNLYFEIIFFSYNNLSIIEDNAYRYMNELEKSGKIKDYIFIRNSNYSYSLEIDKDKCRNKGINPDDIKNILDFLLQSTKMSGKVLSNDNIRYKITVNNSGDLAANIEKLSSYPWKVTSIHGTPQMITLQDLVKISPILSEKTVSKYNGLRCKHVRVTCKENVTAGEIQKIIRDLQKKELPEDIYVDFTGSLKSYEQNSGQMMYIFLACLLSIFLILAVLFNSFGKSLLVMATVPLAFTGAIIVLYYYGSINIYSTIGGITLVALITKHGILFMSKEGDVVNTAAERLRPVLMTTVAMILGNVPLLLYENEAMAPLKQMAYVIVPGLIYGTLMVLVVFPLLLSLYKNKNSLPPLEKSHEILDSPNIKD
jgi:multidrug efflux pump